MHGKLILTGEVCSQQGADDGSTDDGSNFLREVGSTSHGGKACRLTVHVGRVYWPAEDHSATNV